MGNGWILLMMGALFLGLGYLGVPVAFSLMAGVIVATLLTPISLPSIMGQLFNGVDSEALLAVPFFLLVGELMTSANVVGRMIDFSQALIGHLRGGLAQVVTLFSMFFSGISGSSSADVAVLSRTLARSMEEEGYDRGFTAALIASASTMANLIPPSIMAGILTGWFTPTEAGMIAVVYILLVLIPCLNWRHIRQLPLDFVRAGLLYSIPLITVAAASAFGWMLAYLHGPDAVSDWISSAAGTDPLTIMFLLVAAFVIIGDFVDAIPAIIIFMPIINRLTELGGINPVHMGVVIIVTLAFGLITPPYGLALLMAAKFVDVPFSVALVRSLPLYIVFFATIAFCILFPDIVLWLPKHVLPESVGCFKNPSGPGYICP